MIETLVLDEYAAVELDRAVFSKNWFNNFSIPTTNTRLRRVLSGHTVYILSAEPNEDSKLFVINVGNGGLLDAPHPEVVMSRALRIALNAFTHIVGIPRNYKIYHRGSLLSIYAYNLNLQNRSRLYFKRYQGGSIFLYAMTDKKIDISDLKIRNDLYEDAVQGFEDALIASLDYTNEIEESYSDNFGITLNNYLGASYIKGGTLDEWCGGRLTVEQMRVVNAPLDRPIRLRGSAGTGKTQSLTIKCLKELFRAEIEERKFRIAFITHSAGVAHDVVKGMMVALDPKNHRQNVKFSCLWIGSLYQLAQEQLSYDQKQVMPLSLDGVEGRKEQEEWLEVCIEECIQDKKFERDVLSKCSAEVRNNLKATPIDRIFLRELANEVACVLDADGIRKSDQEAVNRYLSEARAAWQMSLPSKSDRRAILEIHDRYLNYFIESDVINLDQMVADLYRYLNSNEWSLFLRKEKGFDFILIDELHYFNRQERMIFHHLFRLSESHNGFLPMFMAYDVKQSTDDKFLTQGGVGRFFKSLRSGKTDLIELTKVFRSTPEIARFIERLDGAFPALDLEGEWTGYTGVSANTSGDMPDLRVYVDNVAMIDSIVSEAYREAGKIGGREVAVLCMSEDLYLLFSRAGRIARRISVISSNTDLTEIRNTRRRCVFSMPETVAGLQFKRVYVLNVDKHSLDLDELGFGERRRLISRLYLAASRASEKLTLAATRDRGGFSEILKTSLESGVLINRNI